MNPFKKGDKVRFIDNELNRAEAYFMEYEFIVDKVTDKPLCFLKFDDETGYNYPHPVSPLRLELAKPPAKFGNVKVGDWVEHVKRGQLQVVRLDTHVFKCSNGNSYKYTNGNCIAEDDYILRIVPPEEVEVEITLKVKNIRRQDDNSFICITNVKEWTFGISYDDIPQFQAEQVKAILKA